MIFKKKSKGCSYCKERTAGYRNVIEGTRWTKVNFNYCPICGKKMKEGKVDE